MPTAEGKSVLCEGCPAQGSFLGSIDDGTYIFAQDARTRLISERIVMRDKYGAQSDLVESHYTKSDEMDEVSFSELLQKRKESTEQVLPELKKMAVERVALCTSPNTKKQCPALNEYAIRCIVSQLNNTALDTN